MDALRVMTAGSVDDGKSTLIGRLLYDSHLLLEDQLHAITSDDERNLNLAYVTDGLKAERDRGITIDVAYRYFNTPKRKFILADTPGHVRYTRNTVTAATVSDVALLMIDAQNGLVEQTKRHSFLASLFGIDTAVVCVNKMDRVCYDETVFNKIVADYKALAVTLRFKTLRFVPVSALNGDNVVHRSQNMPWYDGEPLLELLEKISVEHAELPLRLSVQHAFHADGFNGVAGFVWSGKVKVGDRVIVLPDGNEDEVVSIDTLNGPAESVEAMRSVTLRLKNHANAGRGSLIASPDRLPRMTTSLTVTCCWLGERPLRERDEFILRIGTAERRCKLERLTHKIDIDTLAEVPIDAAQPNDVVKVRLTVDAKIPVDDYYENRYTGSMILIDPESGRTVAAAVVG